MNERCILSIKELEVEFKTFSGIVKAVNIEELEILQGEFLGLVGETGCGKTVTSLAVCGLISGKGKISAGEIFFNGEDLLTKSPAQAREIRGREIAMIFQDPTSSLNPVFTVGDMITRIIQKHRGVSRKEAANLAVEAFNMVRLPTPESILCQYPHQLSGGMCQRVMIAMALACGPKLLIADEPTTALDVTIAAQILELLNEIRSKIDLSLLLITHNLGVVAQVCDRVAVMYAGNVVEIASTRELFKKPLHPYTAGLLRAVPAPQTKGRKLAVIEGMVPNLLNPPPGCRFHPRCPHARDICKTKVPLMEKYENGRRAACHLIPELRKVNSA